MGWFCCAGLASLSYRYIGKTAFLAHLYIKCIILPRQTRDKHRENSKTIPFSQDSQATLTWNGSAKLDPAPPSPSLPLPLLLPRPLPLRGFFLFVPSLSWEIQRSFSYSLAMKTNTSKEEPAV